MMQQVQYSQEIIDVFNEFCEACNETTRKIAELLKPLAQKIKKVLWELWETAWQCYRNAGMPYDETDEGFLRWWNEIHLCARESLQRDLAWQAVFNRMFSLCL